MMFPPGVDYHRVEVDSPVIESANALDVDIPQSVARARGLLSRSRPIIERECSFLRECGATAIAADLPFLAGQIARESGLHGVALGNFTWDWIFEGHAEPALLREIRDSYAGLSTVLRFPLSHREGWDIFGRVIDVPLVTPRSVRPREVIRRELGLESESRPTVLIGGRARLSPEVISRIRRECDDFVFLLPDTLPSFSDLLRAADLVVAKIGYSIAAECIAEGKRLLYPPRTGFREETILTAETPKYMTIAAIPESEWSEGEWKNPLQALLELPPPPDPLPSNGADVCARHLITVSRG